MMHSSKVQFTVYSTIKIKHITAWYENRWSFSKWDKDKFQKIWILAAS